MSTITSGVAAELALRRADVVQHERWSLQRHLTVTHDILRRWRQPEHVCLAGLMHSVYSTDGFSHSLFARDEREHVRALIGPDAERLVHLFCSLDRRELFAAVALAGDALETALRLPDRRDGTPIDLSPRDVGELLLLHIANMVEQCAAPDGAPSPWLAHAAQLTAWARPLVAVVPPVFDAGTALVTPDDEQRLLTAYAGALPPEDATRPALAAATDALPWVGEPFICEGLFSLASRDAGRAAALGARARSLLEAWGTPWDKRLALAEWLELADLLTTAAGADPLELTFLAGRVRRALATARTPVALHALLAAAGAFAAPPLPPRFATYVASFRDDAAPSASGRYPGLGARPWHDPATFAIVRELEAEAPAIARECAALRRDGFHRESENIAREGAWDVALLLERGRLVQETARRAPVTTRIIERHRTVRGPLGLAYFSRLAPHTRIAPHAGPTNLRLRCHLGLEIPPECGLRVGDVEGAWTENRCIVFDDSFVHEAWNDSDRERLVLIVDLWHPDLGEEEIALLDGLHRLVAASAANLTAYWANNEAARRKNRPQRAR